jgi:DNA topoisomerase-1
MGTAMWVIDVLALRVGGEKGEDEADTVGCCSLRREHMTFNEDENSFEMELEFLGKDSMLFKQSINFAKYGDLGKLV